MTELHELRALEAAATPAPWTASGVWNDEYSNTDADIEFIAALRNVAAELLDVVDAARNVSMLPQEAGYRRTLYERLAALDAKVKRAP